MALAATSLIAPMASSLIAVKRQESEYSSLLPLL